MDAHPDDELTEVLAALAAGVTSRQPQAAYRMLRRRPVTRIPGVGALVSRRTDVEHVLHHPELFSSGMAAVHLGNVRPLIPLQIDPPDHRRYRRLLDPAFAPGPIGAIEDRVTDLVNRLIDGFADAAEIDMAARFSVPFPSQVFLELFGLPADELPRFLAMKDGVIRPERFVGQLRTHPDAVAHVERTAASIYEYFAEVLDAHRRPGGDDLLDHLLAAEVDGRRLTREELLDVCFLFLIAGLDTVSAALDCCFGHLAEHPYRRRRLVEDPSTIPAALEELLRWETPVVMVARVAVADTEIGGCPVSAGEPVLAVLGSADTDSDDLDDPAAVRWDRTSNRHLAFGGGPHRCLGSHLARMELTVALREWHRRIPDYRIPEGVTLSYTPGIRSLDTFPLELGRSL